MPEAPYQLEISVTIQRGNEYHNRLTFQDSFQLKAMSFTEMADLMRRIHEMLECFGLVRK